MKQVLSFAILIAAAAASASASTTSLRGSDEKRDLKVNDIRLLQNTIDPNPNPKPKPVTPDRPDLPTDLPELTEKAQDNASDKGKENGRPFGGGGCAKPTEPCEDSSDCCDGLRCSTPAYLCK